MMVVEEGVELRMKRLDLSLRGAAEEAMPLGEVDSMMQHVQLRERLGFGLGAPVLMNVAHHAAPRVDIGCRPVVRSKQAVMQLLQPAGEDRVRGRSRRGEGGGR